MAPMGLIVLPWSDEPGIQLTPELAGAVRTMIAAAATTKGATMQSATQAKPAYFIATADIPELGIMKNNMVTVEQSGRCTVAFELNAERFTPSMVARLRQVHA
jgi:hypothetical protein